MFPLSPFSVMGHFSVGPPPLTAHFWPFFTWLDSLSLPGIDFYMHQSDPFPWTSHDQQEKIEPVIDQIDELNKMYICVCVYLSMETTRPSAMTSWSHPASRYIILYRSLSSCSLLRNISNAFLEMRGLINVLSYYVIDFSGNSTVSRGL